MRERQRAGHMQGAACKLIVGSNDQSAIDCAVRDTLTFGCGPEVGSFSQPLSALLQTRTARCIAKSQSCWACPERFGRGLSAPSTSMSRSNSCCRRSAGGTSSASHYHQAAIARVSPRFQT
jgi:hypothetical protein